MMIVRDEEAIIDRCLQSVRSLIDRYCIVDTGSTDSTKERIRAALDGVPGELYERPWRSFGENLTEACQLARGEGWLLRLDADMTVTWHPGLRDWLASEPDLLTCAWLVEVVDRSLRYRLPLLMRAHLVWRYVGPTHEYLDSTGRKLRPLNGLTVYHHADGSSRPQKFERDLALLQPAVEAGDPRSIFYAAQSYRDIGRLEEAISLYEQRAKLGGWEEERWYAEYQSALLRRSPEALISCWFKRPHRHEPLMRAAEIVKERGTDDILFVEA